MINYLLLRVDMLEALYWIRLVIPLLSDDWPLAVVDLGGFIKLLIKFYYSTINANYLFILFIVQQFVLFQLHLSEMKFNPQKQFHEF